MGWKDALKAVAAGLVPLLSACEDGPAVVSNYDKAESLIQSTVTYANSKGPVLAEIHGNPFAIPPETLGTLVRGQMSAAIGGIKIKYTGEASETPQPGTRIIVLFGAPNTVSGHRLCSEPLPPPAVSPDKLTVRGVLCSEGELLSDAEGWARRITGPDDPRFRRLIFDLTRMLLKWT